jgi:hypothetical protein
MAYDSVRGEVVMFGGSWGDCTAGQNLADTWVWDGSDWEERHPATEPPQRCELAMAFDAARGQTVLFGGLNWPDTLNDTWTWDGSNWTRQHPSSSPPARASLTMAYDSLRNQVVVFGGIFGPL